MEWKRAGQVPEDVAAELALPSEYIPPALAAGEKPTPKWYCVVMIDKGFTNVGFTGILLHLAGKLAFCREAEALGAVAVVHMARCSLRRGMNNE